MPITKSARKHLRVSGRKRVFNLRVLKTMRSLTKELKELIAQNKVKEARKMLAQVFKAIDKAAKRGVIKKNTAARKKSKLAKAMNRFAKK